MERITVFDLCYVDSASVREAEDDRLSLLLRQVEYCPQREKMP